MVLSLAGSSEAAQPAEYEELDRSRPVAGGKQRIDLNSATLDQLKTRLKLPDEVAKGISKGRPYPPIKKSCLPRKFFLPPSLFQNVKTRIAIR